MARHGKGVRKGEGISWVTLCNGRTSVRKNVAVSLVWVEDRFPSRTSMHKMMVEHPWAGCSPDISIVLGAKPRPRGSIADYV